MYIRAHAHEKDSNKDKHDFILIDSFPQIYNNHSSHPLRIHEQDVEHWAQNKQTYHGTMHTTDTTVHRTTHDGMCSLQNVFHWNFIT